MSQRLAALPHREPRFLYILFQFRNQTPMVTVHGAYCVIVGSIFDANQQDKTRLENLFYHRDVITIAKQKPGLPVLLPFLFFYSKKVVSFNINIQSISSCLFLRCRRHHTDIPLTVDRYTINPASTDMSVDTRSILDRYSVDTRPSIGR